MLDFPSFLIKKHPIILLVFCLFSVGVFAIPIVSSYEAELNTMGISVNWINYSCIVCPVYFLLGTLCVLLYIRYVSSGRKGEWDD